MCKDGAQPIISLHRTDAECADLLRETCIDCVLPTFKAVGTLVLRSKHMLQKQVLAAITYSKVTITRSPLSPHFSTE
jgi:hypothetical protein